MTENEVPRAGQGSRQTRYRLGLQIGRELLDSLLLRRVRHSAHRGKHVVQVHLQARASELTKSILWPQWTLEVRDMLREVVTRQRRQVQLIRSGSRWLPFRWIPWQCL